MPPWGGRKTFWFFVLSPVGMMTAVVVGAVTLTIMTLEIACHGDRLRRIPWPPCSDNRRSPDRCSNHLGGGSNGPAVFWCESCCFPYRSSPRALISLALLKEHDINFYLAQRPPVFLLAVGVTVAMLVGMAMLIIPRLLSWAFALPLVLFEGLSPSGALKASSGAHE